MAVASIALEVIPRSHLRIGRNHLGRAVFARQEIAEGELICKFDGPLFHTKELPARRKNAHDYFLQVGDFVFLGKSKSIDDYMNHSCEPNCGLIFLGNSIYLKALRDISSGEEITYDYSTTMWKTEGSMACRCGSSKCRKVVQDFNLLPEEVRVEYMDRDIVPPFIRLNYVNGT